MNHGSCLRNKTPKPAAFSRPSMAVDRSDSTGDYIYVVWADCDPATGPEIKMLEGFAQAGVDSIRWYRNAIQKVNQDGGDNDQWWPWITWDECTGMLAVVFMDSRNFGNQAGAETFVAVTPPPNQNPGQYAWSEVRVSDASWNGSPPSQYDYDYIGIAAGDGRAFPVWSDDGGRPGLGLPGGTFLPYTSPLLLWGVEQDSVSATAANNGNGTVMVTTRWHTSLGADAGDSVTLTSPNGVPFVQTCTSCAGVDGKTHTVVMTVPCEPGKWKYAVSSRRGGCIQVRTSDVDSFFVPPVTQPFALMKPKAGTYATCPAGDGAHFDVTVDFGGTCVSQVASTRLTLEALTVHSPLNRTMAFFPQGVPQPADSVANAGNGYSTTVTEKQIGGCDADSATVYLDGVAITKVDVPLNASVDLNGDGGVDSSDLPLWSATYGECEDDPDWDPCADLARNVDPTALKCNDSSDLSMLVSHLSHHWSSPRSKTGVVGSEVTKLIFIGDPEGSRVQAMVRFEGLKGRTAACAILRPTATKLQFLGWVPSAALTKAVFAVAGVDAEGPRVTILAPDVVPDASGNVELGVLSFTLSSTDVAAGDIAVSYEDFASYDALAIQSTQGPDFSAQSRPRVSRLDSNYPNPFNPTTTIQYTLARPGRVRLMIHSVAGRRLRALVDAWQDQGTHVMVWDGRDDRGVSMASGLYLAKLQTAEDSWTRKLVLVR